MKISRTEDIVNWVKGPVVLDVGCAGHTVEPDSPQWLHGSLATKFPKVVGIDLEAKNIEQMKSLGFPDLYVQSAEDIQLNDRFDTIVAGELIEHLSNPGLFLESAAKHLKPDGRLVLTTPNPFSISYAAYAVAKYPRTCQNDQHTAWFCPETLRILLERYHYKITHFELIGYYRPDDPSRAYRACLQLLRMAWGVIPSRFANNTMLIVAEPIGSVN